MSVNCVVDSSGCIVCPALPAVATVLPSFDTTPVIGWGPGGNSIATIDGNLHTKFQLPASVVGVYCGLRGSRDQIFIPSAIEHSWAFANSVFDYVSIMELGTSVGYINTRLPTDVFEIRRQYGVVSYWINNSLAYVSTLPSSGPKIVTANFFASGDAIE